ncbi:MAG: response regulator transcription factor [Chloroflexi bacterium]|nr:response regulator transcription factor [Chloroflexota bacterium]
MADTPRPSRILIAEDEAPLRNLVELSLKNKRYEVIPAEDGQEALERFRNEGPFDLVILDIMMPKKDGFSVLEEIRRESDVPVVMLTALGAADDIVRGFHLGADDYITKPFTFREVAARIEAILRRIRWMKEEELSTQIIRMGGIQLDTETRQVIVGGKIIEVTPIEFKLLHYFMAHDNETISKQRLFEEVWGYEFEGSTNLVEVGVRRLREKIEEDPSHPQYIITVRGMGYRFQIPENQRAR